ncbi:MAG: nucleoside recognition domain-containing protein [Thermovenabulum sp.]|uniref:nucleoside recognition domain-containing protein n=1 Tax=Thermovenabulum sp. TaxID=3100335 RepID=UPI003C7A55F8
MFETVLKILKEAFFGSLSSVKQITVIVIPIMMVLEILKDIGLIDKIAELFSPIMKIYGMKKESGFPLVIGVIIGISYGAGVIFKASKEFALPKKDLYLVTYFLICAHAIFEDTAIIAAIGANGILILTVRLLVAALFTYAASKFLDRKAENEVKL